MENSFYEREEQKNSLILEGWSKEVIDQITKNQPLKTKKKKSNKKLPNQ